ncbi:hypothetical protein lerEdw1_007305 [Lerista edwardsae]|nr:hypothetical protein lerEdw1_007305 [Lerista edwardsae]
MRRAEGTLLHLGFRFPTGHPARPVWTEGGSRTHRHAAAAAGADPSVAGHAVWNSMSTAAGVRDFADDLRGEPRPGGRTAKDEPPSPNCAAAGSDPRPKDMQPETAECDVFVEMPRGAAAPFLPGTEENTQPCLYHFGLSLLGAVPHGAKTPLTDKMAFRRLFTAPHI